MDNLTEENMNPTAYMYELFEVIKLHMKLNQVNRECIYFTLYFCKLYECILVTRKKMTVDLVIFVNQIIYILPKAS